MLTKALAKTKKIVFVVSFKKIKNPLISIVDKNLTMKAYNPNVSPYVLLNTSVPVPSKMMASKKKHLIFYCHFIYFTFILFP